MPVTAARVTSTAWGDLRHAASLGVTPVVGGAGLWTCTSGLPISDGPLRASNLHQGMLKVKYKGESANSLTSQQRGLSGQALRPWSMTTCCT